MFELLVVDWLGVFLMFEFELIDWCVAAVPDFISEFDVMLWWTVFLIHELLVRDW